MKKIQSLLPVICILLITCGILNSTNAVAQKGPETPSADSLAADFDILVKYLEQTHPDPYSGFGGKVFFHIKANEIKEQIAANHYSVAEFASLANEFMAHIRDGHTSIYPPAAGNTAGIPENKKALKGTIAFKCIPDGLIISRISEPYGSLTGTKLESVNGISLDSLLIRITALMPCENKYGAYAKLANSYYTGQILQAIFPQADTITFETEDASGKRASASFPFNTSPGQPSEQIASLPGTYPAGLGNTYLGCGFADNEKDIMLLRVTSIMARENLEFVLQNNWQGSFQQLENHYKWYMKREMPRKNAGNRKHDSRRKGKATAGTNTGNTGEVDTLAALAGVPSFSETFYNMLEQMKRHGSKNLIIDLRGNGGGWTPITLPSLYMMYGDAYLTTPMNADFYKIVSPLVLRKENHSLEDYSKMYGRQIQYGDILFPWKEQDVPIAESRKSFISSAMCCIPGKLPADGKPVYTPEHVYVITDAGSFSAAFHYTFFLWKMGAVITGVPSSQAPNTFMESTPFTLPYTALKGSISNSMQVFLPANDSRAQTFTPRLIPSYEDYQKYNFDTNTEVLFLLDKIKNTPDV